MKTIYDSDQDTILCLGLDIETMDVRKTAKVISIGAVLYELPLKYDPKWEYREENSFYVNIDPTSYPASFTTGKDTMEWWFTQPEAFSQLAPDRKSAKEAFDAFYHFYYNGDIEGRSPKLVVAKPSHFDVSIVEHAFDAVNDSTHRTWVPWRHWEVFCLRSLFTQLGFDQKKIPFEGTVHNALDDARWQARTHTAAHLEFLQMKKHSDDVNDAMNAIPEEKIEEPEFPLKGIPF
uniref:Exonuclease n=1 Tax=Ochrobactrum phage ORM_20 TaxID=2985243 RepID=A0A9N6WZG6_9VIRU|nr:exonuclease [Ochrobactrum phage ORM_20]